MTRIRPAVPADLTHLPALVQRAIEGMHALGNPQWGADYPTMSLFAGDVARGELFAAVDGQDTLLGVVCLNQEEADEYAAVPWLGEGSAFTIHRMVVDPAAQGQGVGRAFFSFAEDMARGLGLSHIKADTYSLNAPMQALMTKMGFQRVGEVHFTRDMRPLPFLCFEKLL